VAGTVTLEILNPAGEAIRRYSSADRQPPVNPDTLSIPAFWIRTPEPLSTAAGMHRWVWDLLPTPPAKSNERGGNRDDRTRALPGTYTVKLTVGERSYTQPLRVRMDPRAK
jgi:hypothetical protein